MNLRSSYYVALALLLGMPAYATPPAQPVSSSESLAMASSDSTAVAGALAASSSQATGGDASSGSVSISGGGSGGTSSASGVGVAGSITNAQNTTALATMGDVSSQSGDSTSSAVSGNSEAQANGGDMSTSVTVQGDHYEQVRNAPSVAQGSIVIQTCSAGGNAGGSNTSGSAFLGFGYITGSCYDLSYAAAYAALGQKQAACDILRTSKRGSIYKKRGVTLPAMCTEPTPAVEYATKESVDRMFKRTLQK